MSNSSVHGGGCNAVRAVLQSKWERDLDQEGRNHRQATRPKISRRDLAQCSRDAVKQFELQLGIQLFLRMVASSEGDSLENYERNITQIRAAFTSLDYTFEEALGFVSAQLTTTGAKITQRRQVALVKALLPDEMDEVFQRSPVDITNVLSFTRAKALPSTAFVELDEDDPERRDPEFIAELAREAEYRYSVWEDLIEVQGGRPICGLLEEVCELGLDGFAGLMFELGDNPYLPSQEEPDFDEED